MKMVMPSFLSFGILFFAASGCGGGPKHQPITLTVTKGGAPVALAADEKMVVRVVGVDGKGAADGELKEGKYLVGQSNGVPPGKYKVSIMRYSQKAGVQKGPPTPVELKTNIDVSGAAKQEFTVDLDK